MIYTVAEAFKMAQDYHNQLVEQEFEQCKEELESLIDSEIKMGKFVVTTELVQTELDTIHRLAEYFDNLGYLTTYEQSGRIYKNPPKELKNTYFITIRWDAAARAQWQALTNADED